MIYDTCDHCRRGFGRTEGRPAICLNCGLENQRPCFAGGGIVEAQQPFLVGELVSCEIGEVMSRSIHNDVTYSIARARRGMDVSSVTRSKSEPGAQECAM